MVFQTTIYSTNRASYPKPAYFPPGGRGTYIQNNKQSNRLTVIPRTKGEAVLTFHVWHNFD